MGCNVLYNCGLKRSLKYLLYYWVITPYMQLCYTGHLNLSISHKLKNRHVAWFISGKLKYFLKTVFSSLVDAQGENFYTVSLQKSYMNKHYRTFRKISKGQEWPLHSKNLLCLSWFQRILITLYTVCKNIDFLFTIQLQEGPKECHS